MRRKLPFLMGTLTALSLFCATSAQAQDEFKDDGLSNHWAYQAVTDLQQKGVLEGYPDGYYRGKRTLTRYEFADAIKRLRDRLLLPRQSGPRRISILTELEREIALVQAEADKHVAASDVPAVKKKTPVVPKASKAKKTIRAER